MVSVPPSPSPRPGVETLWNLMPEMKVEPDEELRSIVSVWIVISCDLVMVS